MNSCGGQWGGCIVSKVSKALVIIGGLNWGLVGVGALMGKGGWDLVAMTLGTWPMVQASVYVLVGIAAVVQLIGCRCAKCKAACASCGTCNTEGVQNM